jgi:regulator of PEP synthase PpsR (kinase-PPPase family)
VLVGVSRVSKSVTCFFLALRGLRAANVPLTPDVEPPAELLRLDPKKVIALTMTPRRLQRLRQVRSARWSGAMQAYAERERVDYELGHAHRLVAEHGWRSIDVSYKAVEEVTAEVLALLGLK